MKEITLFNIAIPAFIYAPVVYFIWVSLKRLHERYAKEGINIPYPIRAINYAQEKAK